MANSGPALRFFQVDESNWQEHPRFAGVLIQKLVTSSENPAASTNRVRVPPGRVIDFHIHENQVEMVYVLSGQAGLVISGRETPFEAGQMVAIPAGLEHSLINRGSVPVELLTIFTPPQS